MSFVVVVESTLASKLDPVSFGAEAVRVRRPGESATERAERLRELLSPTVDTILLIGSGALLAAEREAARPLLGLVADHLNLTGDNPLVGPNDDAWGPRFPDLTNAWDVGLRGAVRSAALDARIEIHEGVLASVRPDLGTMAERRMWRSLGAEMAARAFADEAIVARHAGRRVVGMLSLDVGATDDVADELAARLGQLASLSASALTGAGT